MFNRVLLSLWACHRQHPSLYQMYVCLCVCRAKGCIRNINKGQCMKTQNVRRPASRRRGRLGTSPYARCGAQRTSRRVSIHATSGLSRYRARRVLEDASYLEYHMPPYLKKKLGAQLYPRLP